MIKNILVILFGFLIVTSSYADTTSHLVNKQIPNDKLIQDENDIPAMKSVSTNGKVCDKTIGDGQSDNETAEFEGEPDPFSAFNMLLDAKSTRINYVKVAKQFGNSKNDVKILFETTYKELGESVQKKSSFIGQHTTGDKVVYVFFDPLCAYSQKEYKLLELNGKVDLNGIKVVWIPVGFSEKGKTTAYKVLHDQQYFKDLIAKIKKPIGNQQKLSYEQRELIFRNDLRSVVMQGQGVPYFVYKDRNGYLHGVSGFQTVEEIKGFFR